MLKIRYLCCIPPVQRVHRRVFYIPLQGICCKQNIQKIKFVWNLPCMLIIYSSIILRYCILGTLQQHSNTLLITKSKMYIGVRQIQVGKRIVLSENKHLNINTTKNIVETLSTIFLYCFINARLDYRSYLCNLWAVAKWSNICYIRRNTILSK